MTGFLLVLHATGGEHILLDSAVTLLGILNSILTMLSFKEYAALMMVSGILSFKNSITATVGTSFFITSYAVEWGNMAAAITLSTIPTALFIFVAQKALVKGMTSGSVKG